MKKLILILLCLVAGVSGAKYTFIGDSRLALDTAVCNEFIRTLNNGSTFVNRSISGYGWVQFDQLIGNYHWVEYYAKNTDASDYVVLQLGVNNTWDSLAPSFSGAWRNDTTEYQLLDKFVNIVKGMGKIPIVVEMQSSFSYYYDNDLGRLTKMLNTIIRRNAMRKEYCASHSILYVPTFDAFSNTGGHPNPTYYNSDSIHFNRSGSLLFGQLLASPSVPTSTKVYTTKQIKFTNANTYTTTNKLLYTFNLSKITDSIFWYNVKPNGTNLIVKVNGVQVRKNLREFDSYARRGTLRFQHTGAVSTVDLIAHKTQIDSSVSVFDSCGLLRLYPLDERESNPTVLSDLASGVNGNVTDDRLQTYYSNTVIPNTKQTYKYVSAQAIGASTPSTGISGLSGYTVDFWMHPYNDNWWTQQNNIVFAYGSSTSATVRHFWIGNLNTTIGTTSSYITFSIDTMKKYIPDSTWSKVTISYDLSQSVQANKPKVVINGVDISAKGSLTGTLPTVTPTSTDSLYLFGWSSSGFMPVGAAYRDYKIRNVFTPVVESQADYNLQTSSGWQSVPQSTTIRSSRWDAFKSSTKSAYKKTWK